MQNLTLGRGRWAGQRLTLMPWQEEDTRGVFALDDDGDRKHHEANIWVSRKNAKTNTVAAWGLALLTEEPGGEVLGVAAKRDQAKIMMDEAKRFVRNSSLGGTPLDAKQGGPFVVRRNAIYYPEMDAVYRTISSEASSEHGANPHAVLADELHAWRDPELLYAMTTATAARENPLVIKISTPGEIPSGLWWEEWKRTEAHLRGDLGDERFYGRMYTAPDGCDIYDRDAWRAANPALGHIVTEEWLERQADTLPEYVFRRLHLCQPTTAHDRWLPLTSWRACSGEPEFPEDAEVYLALDAALSRDTFGAAMVRMDKQGVAHVRSKVFTPDREGGYIDPAEVETWVLGIAGRGFRIKSCRYDPAYMGLLASSLADRGVLMEAVPQTSTNMTRAAENVQRLVLDERLRHGGDPTLDQQMANVGVKPSDRGVRISKGKSGGPVDAAIALAMALDAAVEAASQPDLRSQHFAFSVGKPKRTEDGREVGAKRRKAGAGTSTPRSSQHRSAWLAMHRDTRSLGERSTAEDVSRGLAVVIPPAPHTATGGPACSADVG